MAVEETDQRESSETCMCIVEAPRRRIRLTSGSPRKGSPMAHPSKCCEFRSILKCNVVCRCPPIQRNKWHGPQSCAQIVRRAFQSHSMSQHTDQKKTQMASCSFSMPLQHDMLFVLQMYDGTHVQGSKRSRKRRALPPAGAQACWCMYQGNKYIIPINQELLAVVNNLLSYQPFNLLPCISMFSMCLPGPIEFKVINMFRGERNSRAIPCLVVSTSLVSFMGTHSGFVATLDIFQSGHYPYRLQGWSC